MSPDLNQTILHVDRALPDGSILFHHTAPSAHASHTGEVLLKRLWGDAKERSCVSSLSWRQQPLALEGGGGRAGRPGAALVPMVEHGGDVLATDASGHLFLLSHQPPPRAEDLAPGVVMAGQVFVCVCVCGCVCVCPSFSPLPPHFPLPSLSLSYPIAIS